MEILKLKKRYRHLLRIKDIAKVLARHGFGNVIDRLHLRHYAPMINRLSKPMATDRPGEVPTAKRVVSVFEELGPTFVKLGQLLSQRPDLIPPEYVDEFSKLQDKVAPFSSEEAIKSVEEMLKAPLDRAFKFFDKEPHASGSIAQVHNAVLKNGKSVMVKIKRPKIKEVIESDIEVLSKLADLFDRFYPEAQIFRPKQLVEEFSRVIHREINFVTEAAATAKMRKLLADDESVRIPEIYWDYTDGNVMTLERLCGINIRNTDELITAGVNRKATAHRLGKLFLKQYFSIGRFHADPHPGNISINPDGTINLFDFGMTGHLTEELKNQLAITLFALVEGDIDLILTVYAEIGTFSEATDPQRLKPDILEVIDSYYGIPVKHINMNSVFADATRIAREHEVTLPKEFILLAKSFVTVMALCQHLDNQFDVATILKPQIKNMVTEKFSPRRLIKRGALSYWNLFDFLKRLPSELRTLLSKVQTGKIQLIFKHAGLDHFISEIDKSSNRISFSVIIGSVIVGSSLIIHAKVGPKIMEDVPVLGIGGYVIAGVLGLWLVWAIIKSGKL